MISVRNQDDQYLDESAQLTVLNSNAVRSANGRQEVAGEDQRLTVQEFNANPRNRNNVIPNEEELALRKMSLSSNALAKMMFYPISSRRKRFTFSVIRDSNANKWQIRDQDKLTNWADAKEGADLELRKTLGELAVQNLCHQGDGFQFIRKQRFSNSTDRIVSEKEADTLMSMFGGEWRPVEIKHRGQLGMAKAIFFKSRIIEMVSKSFISGSTSAMVFVRDDRELQGVVTSIQAVDVLFWDDVLRLVPEWFIENMRDFRTRFVQLIYHESIVDSMNKLEVREDGLHIHIPPKDGVVTRVKPLALKSLKWIPSDFCSKTSARIVKPNYVVVGRGIPSFEYNLSNVFLRYKFQHGWQIIEECKRLVLLVEDNNGLKDTLRYFRPFQSRISKMEVLIFTKDEDSKEINKMFGEVFRHDKAAMPTITRYTDFNDLGRKLYKEGISMFTEPIKRTLLLLGAKDRVPVRMPIARLDFLTLETAGTFDFTQLAVPGVVVAIGNLTECIDAEKIALREFPNTHFEAFVLPGVDGIMPPNFTACRNQNLEAKMAQKGIQMYKSFDFEKNVFVAK